MKKSILVFLCMAAVLLAVPAWAVKPATFGLPSLPSIKIGDGGMTWSVGQRGLASYGQNLYAAWTDSTYGQSQTVGTLRVTTSTDSGLTWGRSLPVDALGSSPEEAAIAVSDNNGSPVVHLVWGEGGNIYYANSTNNARYFNTPVLLGSTTRDWSASVAAQGMYVHVTWVDSTSNNIMYIRSTDYGSTWGLPQTIQSGITADEAAIAANALGKVYIAYLDYTLNQRAVGFKASLDNGDTWTITSRFSGNFDYLSLAADNTSRVYIAERDLSNGNDLICLYSSNDGSAWLQSSIGMPTNSEDYSIAVDSNGNPSIAFSSLLTGDFLELARSSDYGASWSTYQIDDGSGDYPNLVIDSSGKANIFFERYFPGAGHTIYFTKEK